MTDADHQDHPPPGDDTEARLAAPESERALLGVCLHTPECVPDLLTRLDGPEFADPRHEQIWDAYRGLVAAGDTAPRFEALSDRLRRTGLDRLLHYLTNLIELGSYTQRGAYVDTIRDYAERRHMITLSVRIAQYARNGHTPYDAYGDLIDTAETRLRRLGGTRTERFHFAHGGGFILDTDPSPQPVWGDGSDVLWAEGEALIIAGRQGLGKTTLAQQLALGRIGCPGYDDLLGQPVTIGHRNVLYLAMDRPRQAARSFRRMVRDEWRDMLDARLLIWPGPPPSDLAKNPDTLLELANAADADTVIVDSLKDAAIGLKDDEVAAGYNRARQTAVAAGVELVELHHDRKQTSADNAARRRDVDDLYGSTWLPSGAGSVLQLAGNAGDPVVTMHHVKQPASEVGPVQVLHDHDTGRSLLFHALDLVALVSARLTGMNAVEVACLMFDTDKPTPSEKEKARRRLDAKVRKGLLSVLDPGDRGTKTPKVWAAP